MCLAVSCVRLLKFLGRVFSCCNVGHAFGRSKYWSVSVLLLSSCFYLYAFLWRLPFCLGMFYLSLAYFLGHFIVLFFIFVLLSLCIRFSFTFSACSFCFVFFCFARTLAACFSLGARLFSFVIIVVSAFCSMQCGLVPHHLSLIRFSVFCRVIFSFFTYY